MSAQETAAPDAAVPDAEAPARRRHPVLATMRRLLKHRLFVTGLVLFGIIVLAAAFAPLIATEDPNRLAMRFKFLPPSAEHPFGTDNFGRSQWSRVVWGAQLSIAMGLAVVLLNAVFGTLIGATAGYFRRFDDLIMRLNDALMAFPAILLAIAITAVLGPSTVNVVIAIAIAYVPRTARIVRASVLVIREMEYLQAARVSGAGDLHIIVKHVLPNSLGPLIVQLTFIFAYAILAEAALSFLGIGPPPPAPSWGNIIAEGRDYSVEAWWVMLFPGLAVSLAALGMNLLGDGLRDVLDPRLKIET